MTVTPDYDVRRGHAIIRSDDGTTAAIVVSSDHSLAIDLPNGFLNPDEARALGTALISWAAWKRDLTPTVDHYQQTGGL